MKVYQKQHKTDMDKIKKIRQEIERLYYNEAEKDESILAADAYKNALEKIESFIDSLPDENNPEPYNPVYDEDYLNEKIKKASESWKGVDVDAMLAEYRGYEEPDKSLEEAADDYADYNSQRWQEDGDIYYDYPKIVAAFIAGAEWQKEQFEKNRLAACDAQTREEYERETDFVDKFIAENQRTPTFSDAINYGIAWQKEQMMKEAVEGYVNYYEDSGGKLMAEAQVGCPYHIGDKVKIVIVKED